MLYAFSTWFSCLAAVVWSSTYKGYICKTLIYSNFLSSYMDCLCRCNPRSVFKLYIGILLPHSLTRVHFFKPILYHRFLFIIIRIIIIFIMLEQLCKKYNQLYTSPWFRVVSGDSTVCFIRPLDPLVLCSQSVLINMLCCRTHNTTWHYNRLHYYTT